MINELEYVRLFKELDGQSLEHISEFSVKLALADGEILISENETQPYDLYVLCDGRVEVVSNSTDITSGEVTLSRQDKEIFGEMSWLTGRKRTATIRSLGEVEIIRIDGQKLTAYLQTHPQAGYIIMRAIANLLAESLNLTDQLLKQILWNSTI